MAIMIPADGTQYLKPLRLKCQVQPYAWGKPAKDSLIATLAHLPKNEAPCAELWIGTHEKAPSIVEVGTQKISLRQLIAEHPLTMLGTAIDTRYAHTLPYLCKVLSVGKALSIQAHPNKKRAEVLHARNPTQYPDANHKPEIAVALTEVQLLSGFLSLDQILYWVEHTPEFAALLGVDVINDIQKQTDTKLPEQEAVKRLFYRLMHVDASDIQRQSAALFKRIASKTQRDAVEQWILKLAADYSQGDVGIFCFFMLNIVTLTPGEAIFVAANQIHAHLCGEMVECMANSDNVVRAGLTNKFIDRETLCEMLEYLPGTCKLLRSQTDAEGWECYGSHAQEFELAFLTIRHKMRTVAHHLSSPEVLLVLDGTVTLEYEEGIEQLSRGDIVFLPYALKNISVESNHCTVVRARVSKN